MSRIFSKKDEKIFCQFKKSVYFCNRFQEKKIDGVVAQLVEQRTENPCVTGSIPVDATKKRKQLGCFLFCLGDFQKASERH